MKELYAGRQCLQVVAVFTMLIIIPVTLEKKLYFMVFAAVIKKTHLCFSWLKSNCYAFIRRGRVFILIPVEN